MIRNMSGANTVFILERQEFVVRNEADAECRMTISERNSVFYRVKETFMLILDIHKRVTYNKYVVVILLSINEYGGNY